MGHQAFVKCVHCGEEKVPVQDYGEGPVGECPTCGHRVQPDRAAEPTLLDRSDLYRKGTPVRAGKLTGHTTGTTRPCRPGCPARRVGIRWPIKKGQTRSRITWPCSNDLHLDRIDFTF